MNRYYHITVEDKKLIKGRIDYIFGINKKNPYKKLENEFGVDVVTLIDKEIMNCFVDKIVKPDHMVRYIDVYDRLEKELGFIFDINAYETVSDFWFSEKGSIFEPNDAVEIGMYRRK